MVSQSDGISAWGYLQAYSHLTSDGRYHITQTEREREEEKSLFMSVDSAMSWINKIEEKRKESHFWLQGI